MDGWMSYVVVGISCAIPVIITGGGVIYSYGRLSRKVDSHGDQIGSINDSIKEIKDDLKECTREIGVQAADIGELKGYRNGQRNSRGDKK